MGHRLSLLFVFMVSVLVHSLAVGALQYDAAAAQRALVSLTEKPHMGITVPIFDGKFLFENLWQVWNVPPAEKARIEKLSSDDKKKLVFSHYGLLTNPKNSSLPLGFVERSGMLATNCLACHGGQVLGQTVIGLPNRSIDLRSLYDDIATLNPVGGEFLKLAGQSLGPERGQVTTYGMEGKAIEFRDLDMNLKVIPNDWGSFAGAQVNAPPWWNINYKTHAFADAALPLTPRIFVTSASSIFESGQDFRGYVSDVADAFELAKSTSPPSYPRTIDRSLALKGKRLFDETCARCHGSYDESGKIQSYPNRIVPLANIGTDPVRTTATPSYQKALGFLLKSWVALDFKTAPNDTGGYLAPPLVGIWSTAPYLHNGSVPTLWDLLHVDSRPVLWKESEEPNDYDIEKVGVSYSEVGDILSEDRNQNTQMSLYYDTRLPGHSASGHDYPDELSEPEKVMVLEFLKLF